MSPDELYLRYLKLKEVTFGVVPEDEWHKHYNDLLEVEKYLKLKKPAPIFPLL